MALFMVWKKMNISILYLWQQKSPILYLIMLYKQTNGVAMESPWEPSLANAFLAHHGKIWLDKCPLKYRPWYYRSYVDDIFVLFKSSDHLKWFQIYLNSRHANMSFTIETEQTNKISFLDIHVIREQGKFTTTVYWKPTFSGACTYFDRFLPNTYKTGVIYTFVNRCFRICSTCSMFHS